MADYDETTYQDALKATGDEALSKDFAIAYKSVKNLKKAPTNDQKLKVSLDSYLRLCISCTKKPSFHPNLDT